MERTRFNHEVLTSDEMKPVNRTFDALIWVANGEGKDSLGFNGPKLVRLVLGESS
jgi:hypothetical protein